MAGIGITILPYELSRKAWKWYCNNYVDIRVYDDDIYIINGVKCHCYKEVLDKLESIAEAEGPENNVREEGEWMVVDDVYCQCPFCNKVEVIFADYCRKCGARLHEPEVE